MTTPSGPSALQLLAEALGGGAPWPPLPPIPEPRPGGQACHRITQYREAARLSPAELGRAAGLTESAIIAAENASLHSPVFRSVIAKGLAAMDPRLDLAQVEAELLALPPEPRPSPADAKRAAKAAELAMPPEFVNVTRIHRLEREAARTAAQAARSPT
jgi:hypothetical protein